MKNFWRLFRHLYQYKFLLVVIVLSTILAAALNVSSIALLKPVADVFFGEAGQEASQKLGVQEFKSSREEEVVGGEEKPELEKKLKTSIRGVAISQPLVRLYEKAKIWQEEIKSGFYEYLRQGKKMLLLAILGLVILSIEILKFIFIFLSEYLSNYVGFNVVQQLRVRLYDNILKQDMAFFHRRTTGELMSRISGDAEGIREMIMLIFSNTLQAPVNMIFLIAFMALINWQLTLLLFILGPLTIIPIRYFGRKIKEWTRKAREKSADISSAMQEIISNIVIVKAFLMEKYEGEKFKRGTKKQTKYLLRRRRVRIISSPFMDIIGTVAVVVIMLIGGYFIAETKTMSGSAFFVYLVAMYRLYKPIKKLNEAYGELQKGLAYSERIFEILDTEPTIKDAPGAQDISPLKKEIKFEDVWFAYRGRHWVLRDINLTVPAGKMVALVGPSGAGKSTLVSLLLRFYDPQEGKILFDGRDICQATLNSLRAQIGVVLQQNVLFNDTIRDNITCGRVEILEEKIIEAAKAANAHEFIIRFPEGYDTVVGERGSKLSGGQRQRIAIARAILKDPAILILDEATSSLDSESERKIQEAIGRLIKGRTTIVIAHRLSTVMNADLIVVMDKGEIVEVGTHEELLSLNGLYARLCAVQFQPLQAK